MKNIRKQVDMSSMSRSEIEEYAMNLSANMEALQAKLDWYEEQLLNSRQKRFGASSEKITIDQISLFNEAEEEYDEALKEPKAGDVKPPAAGKKKGHKAKLTKPLPKEVIEYVLTDEERICPVCGEPLHDMKKEIRKEIEIIPAKYIVKEHVIHTYSCRNCEANGLNAAIIRAKSPGFLFRNSLASDTYLKPLYELMHKELKTRDIIHADETELEVLNEPGRAASSKSYMWLYRTSGCDDKKPIVLYEYQPSRSGDCASNFLKGFKGYLQTDGYSGYGKITKSEKDGDSKVIPVGCLAHARRKFDEALKAMPKDAHKASSQAIIGLKYCNKLFAIEEQAKKDNLTYDEIKKLRNEVSKPVFDEFLVWVKRLYDESLPKSMLAKALAYVINQEKALRNYMLDSRLEISNNRAERSIKPFVIGRKNWLFSNTPKGADASAVIYSIMESAVEAGLIPYEYFSYILEVLSNTKDINDELLKTLLPYSDTLPRSCQAPKEEGSDM